MTASTTTESVRPPPDYLKHEDQLCFPIHLASRLVVNAYRPLLEEFGLTYSQYLVMLVLWQEDGLSVAAVGDKLYLDSGTLTPLLKRMEKQGLIVRKRRGSDDRIVENWLTEVGREMKQRAQKVPVQLLCSAKLDLMQMLAIKRVVEGLVQKLLTLEPVPVELVDEPPANGDRDPTPGP